MFRTLVIALSTMAISGSAFAQEEVLTDELGRQIIYQSITEIDIEGANVTATVDGPEIGLHIEPKRAQFAPMIQLRTDFNQEMSVSTNEIR